MNKWINGGGRRQAEGGGESVRFCLAGTCKHLQERGQVAGDLSPVWAGRGTVHGKDKYQVPGTVLETSPRTTSFNPHSPCVKEALSFPQTGELRHSS